MAQFTHLALEDTLSLKLNTPDLPRNPGFPAASRLLLPRTASSQALAETPSKSQSEVHKAVLFNCVTPACLPNRGLGTHRHHSLLTSFESPPAAGRRQARRPRPARRGQRGKAASKHVRERRTHTAPPRRRALTKELRFRPINLDYRLTKDTWIES